MGRREAREIGRKFACIFHILIFQIVTMPIYGQEVLNICHPYNNPVQSCGISPVSGDILCDFPR